MLAEGCHFDVSGAGTGVSLVSPSSTNLLRLPRDLGGCSSLEDVVSNVPDPLLGKSSLGRPGKGHARFTKPGAISEIGLIRVPWADLLVGCEDLGECSSTGLMPCSPEDVVSDPKPPLLRRGLLGLMLSPDRGTPGLAEYAGRVRNGEGRSERPPGDFSLETEFSNSAGWCGSFLWLTLENEALWWSRSR